MTTDPSQRSMPSFVGRGIGFPMRVDDSGSIALTSGGCLLYTSDAADD